MPPATPATAEAFFLAADGRRTGQRYCLFHAAARPADIPAKGAVLYVHPFAEEMNKARRMAALQARALARDGYAVLQIDLLGCGDSSGDFGDASWADWIDDVVHAARWLRRRVAAPLCLWGLRAGCLLAVDAAPQVDAQRLLLWQPVSAGSVVLQQFLRLRLAAGLLGTAAKVSTGQLRALLAAGEAVEVAGYRLAPALALGLERATLDPPLATGRVDWIEVVASPADARLSAAAEAGLARWRQAGWDASGRVVAGPAFWQSVETEQAPELLAATLAALAQPQLQPA